MTRAEIQPILDAHREWLTSGGARGKRADLYGADLTGADLYGANLYGADLYRVGETVRPTELFDENRWNECGSGIHLFITRAEAEAY